MSILQWRQRLTQAWTAARRPRRAWTSNQRAYVELRLPEAKHISTALCVALEALPGVAWARVNAALGRVVVQFSNRPPTLERVIATIDTVERAFDLVGPIDDLARRAFPGDLEPIVRSAAEIATDAGALWLGFVIRVLSREPGSRSLGLAAVVSLCEAVPSLRERVEQRFGPSKAQHGLHSAFGLSQALISGVSGLVVDAVGRSLWIREHLAQRDAWTSIEAELGGELEGHDAAVLPGGERPGSLPQGPIERYINRLLPAMASAFGFSFVATRSPAGSLSSVFGYLPKAAQAGREAFVAELSRALAREGFVVMNPRALRVLDRIDTIVIPAAAIAPRNVRIASIVAVDGFNERDARRNVMRMLDMNDLRTVRDDGKWRLGPLDELRRAGAIPVELGWQIGALRAPGGLLLGLMHRDQLAGLVSLVPMPDPALEALVVAARAAELTLVCAGELDERRTWFTPDRTLPGGERLLDSIRMLQREGHGVCLISDEPTPALAAADFGVGLCARRAHWGAALICTGSFAAAEVVVEAVRMARQASQQSVYLSMVAAVSGLILAVAGFETRTVKRAMMANNATSLLAMSNGIRLARSVDVALARLPSDTAPWHALEVDEALERLGSSFEGLMASVAAERRRPAPAELRPWTRFAELLVDELASPFAPVLVAGAGLSALTGSLLDSLMITGVVGFNAALGAVQRYRTDRAISALDASEAQRVRVRRGGRELEVELDELVLGDVLVLEAGDAVPADARIIAASRLELDESSLTGESLPISKLARPSFAAAVADRSSMIYEGTCVAAGECLAVVTALAEDTQAQRASAHARSAPKTGVEVRLDTLTELSGPIAALSGIALMASGLSLGRPAAEVIGSGVSLAVAAVPEGLPLLASMAQLAAARRLSVRGALVRNPRAVEALGRVDVLCADKTGTLTEGRIRLRLVSDGTREAGLAQLDDDLLEVLCAALRASPTGPTRTLPDSTDRALIEGAHRCGLHRSADNSGFERLSELPFEAGRGYHAVHGRMRSEGDGREYLSIKGAPERVIELCTAEGPDRVAIGDARRTELLASSEALASRGLRVLAVAERLLAARERVADRHVRKLCFRGFLAFADPVRDTARRAIADLRKAGVEIVMITGDHPNTARAIAAELGLAISARGILTGAELELLDDAALDRRVEQTVVFARVTPAQKVRIVRSLGRRGRVVAMTGDGANDAPAIRLADVGIALGQRSTPAARRAADLIVTDERIETLVEAVLEGRALWRSVSDAVALLVGGNLGEIGFTLIVGLLSGRSPLNPRQLLVVNFLTDTAPALAIALRRPHGIAPEQLLGEGPETSLGDALTRDIAWRATVTAGATSFAWLLGRLTGTRKRADTIALLTMVGSQLGQTLAIGGRDPTVLAAGLGSLGLLLALVETPIVSRIFGSRPVGPIALGQALISSTAATAVALIGPRIVKRARNAGI